MRNDQPPDSLEEGKRRAVANKNKFALGVAEETGLAGDFGFFGVGVVGVLVALWGD